MTLNTLIKNVIGVNRIHVESVDKEVMKDGVIKIIVNELK